MKTKLTEFFAIEHPIVLAPMTPAAGGALASAVSAAGGLGLLGGGYGDRTWLEREFEAAGNTRIGCGFITWSLAKNPELLDFALDRRPAAMMLSFADPAPFASRIHEAGVPIICQVHTLDHAKRALDVGASAIVAQGTEAGGHGLNARGTMAFVPAVADLLERQQSDIVLLAAGGIADGRGLAAALMLGADGVLLGSRFWATREALIHQAAKDRVVAATGDETVRTRVYDIARGRPWPQGYTGRLMRNAFIDRWHGREDELAAGQAGKLQAIEAADAAGNYDIANVTVGESIGLIGDLPGAGDVVRRIISEAEQTLSRGSTAFAAHA